MDEFSLYPFLYVIKEIEHQFLGLCDWPCVGDWGPLGRSHSGLLCQASQHGCQGTKCQRSWVWAGKSRDGLPLPSLQYLSLNTTTPKVGDSREEFRPFCQVYIVPNSGWPNGGLSPSSKLTEMVTTTCRNTASSVCTLPNTLSAPHITGAQAGGSSPTPWTPKCL